MNFAILLDIGNIIFFMVGFPQMLASYRNRKNLNALSGWMLGGYLVATIMFGIANFNFGATIAMILNFICAIFYTIQLYWKYKK
jgi:hypothetical protein